MSSLNRVQIIGRLGQDPEVKTLQGGSIVANISLATSEKWKDKQGNAQERTEWHRVQLWGKLGELAGKYLAKGSLVYIEGKLQTRSYEKNGEKRYATEIVGSEMKFLSSNQSRGSQTDNESIADYTGTSGLPNFARDEEIPF